MSSNGREVVPRADRDSEKPRQIHLPTELLRAMSCNLHIIDEVSAWNAKAKITFGSFRSEVSHTTRLNVYSGVVLSAIIYSRYMRYLDHLPTT